MPFKQLEYIKSDSLIELFKNIKQLNKELSAFFKNKFNRTLPINEIHSDRWEKAKSLGFGEGSSIYDNSYIFGDVQVGKNCWIGMNTIIDASGGLKIGNNCTIGAGSHIYTHDNVKATLTSYRCKIDKAPVEIGDNVYIGPQAIISKGVKIGNHSIIASQSLVNSSFPSFSIIAGTPAKKIGEIKIEEEDIHCNYFKK